MKDFVLFNFFLLLIECFSQKIQHIGFDIILMLYFNIILSFISIFYKIFTHLIFTDDSQKNLIRGLKIQD